MCHGLRRGKVWALLCALLAAAAGCATQSQDRDATISQLRLGMNRTDVRAVLGVPRAVETIGHVEFWLYSIDDAEPANQDSADRRRNVGKVGFVNGRVTGWGAGYYNDAIKGLVTADGSTSKEN